VSDFEIETFLTVPRMTAERRHIAVQRMKACIDDDPRYEAFRIDVDGVLAVHVEAITLSRRWVARREGRVTNAEIVRAVDAKLDRAWTALHDYLVNALSAFEPGSPHEAAARCLLDALFPRGPAAVTSLPYIDQHAALKALVERTRTERSLLKAVRTLAAGVLLDRIDELNESYGESLTRQERMSFEEVLEVDRSAWRALTSLVARILGAFPSSEEPDEAARGELLGPIRDQEAVFDSERRSKTGP